MKKLIRTIRSVIFILAMLLAAAGAGFGVVFPNHRDKYVEPEVKIEMVEKKEDESEEDEEKT